MQEYFYRYKWYNFFTSKKFHFFITFYTYDSFHVVKRDKH